MPLLRSRIVHYTPLPPARNGIADYAWRMMEALKPRFRQSVVTGTEGGKAPKGIPVHGQSAAVGHHGLPIYQIGNNWHHSHELASALVRPGLVLLHDLQLLYLYESLAPSEEELVRLMRRSNPRLSLRVAERLQRKQPTSKLPYMLADMLGDLLDQSHRVVVHSNYARRVIRAHHGEEAARKVDVIPHFAMTASARDPHEVRRRYGYRPETKLIVTAGFATRAKRFDIIARVVADLASSDTTVQWIHAGRPDHGDLDLRELVRAYPGLNAHFTASGYLDEDALDDHVAMADVLLNLRFPSVGESSGSLARALAMGACTIVSDTGSYAEIPNGAVVKLSALGGVGELKAALGALLASSSLRRSIGDAAARYATDELNIARYATRLGRSIGAARQHALARALSLPLNKLSRSLPARRQTTWVGPLDGAPQGSKTLAHQTDTSQRLRYTVNLKGKQPGTYVGLDSK